MREPLQIEWREAFRDGRNDANRQLGIFLEKYEEEAKICVYPEKCS